MCWGKQRLAKQKRGDGSCHESSSSSTRFSRGRKETLLTTLEKEEDKEKAFSNPKRIGESTGVSEALGRGAREKKNDGAQNGLP